MPAEPLKKATFQLESSVIEGIRNAVDNGAAPSANVFVEEAVKARLRELRRAELYGAYTTAADDPEFLDEVAAITREFEPASADGLHDSRRK